MGLSNEDPDEVLKTAIDAYGDYVASWWRLALGCIYVPVTEERASARASYVRNSLDLADKLAYPVLGKRLRQALGKPRGFESKQMVARCLAILHSLIHQTFDEGSQPPDADSRTRLRVDLTEAMEEWVRLAWEVQKKEFATLTGPMEALLREHPEEPASLICSAMIASTQGHDAQAWRLGTRAFQTGASFFAPDEAALQRQYHLFLSVARIHFEINPRKRDDPERKAEWDRLAEFFASPVHSPFIHDCRWYRKAMSEYGR